MRDDQDSDRMMRNVLVVVVIVLAIIVGYLVGVA
jgi:hypothetical protein